MAKQEQREIALNFITNAEETKSKVDALLNSLDKTDDSYAELEQQSASLESAIIDVNNAMNNSTGSSNILQNSIKKLEGETTKATTSLSNVKKATDNQAKSTSNLTKEVTSNGGAMAILDTLTGGLASQFKNAYEASGLFQGSLKGIRGALIATGIGAFVVLLGLLIANWDKVTAALNRTNKAQKAVNDAMRAGASNIKAEANELQNLLKIARNETASKEARLNAIKAINAISPEYLGNITLETINTRDVNAQIERYIDLLIKKAQVQALEESIVQVYKDQAAALQDLQDQEESWWGRREIEFNNLFSKETSVAKLAGQERVKAKEDADKKVEALNNKLTAILSESPGLIFKEVEKNSDKTVKNTVKTNKKIVESEEDKLKRLLNLQIRYNKIVGDRTLNDLPNPTIGFELISKERIETLKKEQKEVQEILEEQYKDSKKAVYAFEKWFNDIYYDTQIKREEALLQRQKVSLETFRMYIDGIEEGLDLDGGVFNTFQDYREEVIKFSDSIENSKIKEKFDSIFNVDQLKESSAVLQRFKDDIIDLDTQLTSLDGTGEGVVMTGLFGKNYKKNLENAVKDVKDANKEIIDEQERQALLLAVGKAEEQSVRDYYNKLRADNEKAANEEIRKNLEETERQKLAIVSSSAQASMDLIDAGLEFASEEDRERIKSNAAYKTAMIGLTTIDTFASAMSAYKGMTAAIPGPWGIAAGVAAAASSVAMGMQNVKRIASVKLEGSSGGGGGSISSAGATPNVSFVSSSENQIANSVNANTNAQSQEPIKAYVVTGDINSGQALERNKIESNSI